MRKVGQVSGTGQVQNINWSTERQAMYTVYGVVYAYVISIASIYV